MRIFLPAIVASALLVGCGPKPETVRSMEQEPAFVEPTVIAPVSARGIETAWGAQVEGQTMVITRPGEPTLQITVRSSTPDGTLAWAGEGNSLELTKTACSDGKTAIIYPMTASLSLGGEAMRGCADFTAAGAAAVVPLRPGPTTP